MSLFDDFNSRRYEPSAPVPYNEPYEAATEAVVVRRARVRALRIQSGVVAACGARILEESDAESEHFSFGDGPPQIDSGFVPVANIDEIAPMFALSKVQFKPTGTLLHMVVRNDIIAVALDNNHILRIDLSNPAEIEGWGHAHAPAHTHSRTRTLAHAPSHTHARSAPCALNTMALLLFWSVPQTLR